MTPATRVKELSGRRIRAKGTVSRSRRRSASVIAYFDTSAVVPLLVDNRVPARADALWATAERAVSVRLVYPEARAAAQASRLGRAATQLRAAVRARGTDDAARHRRDRRSTGDGSRSSRRSATTAGYHAVHLAAAVRVHDEDLVLVAGDFALLDAATAEGLATRDRVLRLSPRRSRWSPRRSPTSRSSREPVGAGSNRCHRPSPSAQKSVQWSPGPDQRSCATCVSVQSVISGSHGQRPAPRRS